MKRPIAALGAIAALSCAGRSSLPPRLVHPPISLDPTLNIGAPPERFELANGLRVVVVHDAASNLASVDMRYAVGSVEDPEGKGGLAHLVEHLLFDLGPEAPLLGDRLAEIAIYYNAYTSADETHYVSVGLRGQLSNLLQLEAQRMNARCEQLSDPVFERERDVVLNELRQRTDIESAVTQLLTADAFGVAHPYTRATDRRERELQSLTLADACEFVGRYYAPERAVLVVSGNVDSQAVRTEVAQQFAEILPRRTPRRDHVPPLRLKRQTSRHRLPVQRAAVFVLTAAPVFADREGAYAATVRRLFESYMSEVLTELDYVSSFALEELGGPRAPLDVAAIQLTDPARLQDAVAAFFEKRAKFAEWIDAWVAGRVTERNASLLVSRFESVTGRGSLLADYAQYGQDRLKFELALPWLRGASVGALRRRGERYFARGHSHVVLIEPSRDNKAEADRAKVVQLSRSHDVAEWKAPLEPGEAERALRVAAVGSGAPIAVREFRMPNGMRVLLAPDLEYPLIDIRVVFPVGSLHEPPERLGLAAATASFLSLPAQETYWPDDYEFLRAIAVMGGDMDADVSETETTFTMRGLSIWGPGLLWQLGWTLRDGEISGKGFKRFRELLARNDTDETRRAERRQRAMREALFGRGHPLATELAARADFERLSLDQMRDFRRRFYRPDGAVLIVAGRFDVDDMERRIRDQFGLWRASRESAAARPIPPARARAGMAHFGYEDADTVQVHIGFLFATAPGSPQRAAREVLVELIRQRMESLRARLAATYGIRVQQSFSRGPGLLSISGSVDAERSGQAFAAMRAELDWVRSGHDLASAFARARRVVFRRALAQTLSARAVADHLQKAAAGEVAVDGYFEWARELGAVRLADVKALIDKELGPNGGVVVIAGRRAAVDAAYRAGGIADVHYLR